MTVLQSVRAAIGATLFAVLAASPLRAQQHSHAADSARADSARKKTARPMPVNMPMNMPMGTGDSTKKAKAAPKKSAAAKKPSKPSAKRPPAAARGDSSHAHGEPATSKADSASVPMSDSMPMPMHDSTAMPMKHDTAAAMANTPGMDGEVTGHTGAGSMMTGALDIPMERMGSGTSWLPDAVGLPSRHVPAKGWDVMLHGFVFGQYDTQGGPRGDHQLGSLNWGMLMVSRHLGGGMFQARTMLSLDAATVGNRGYPLLLQSGEAYRGEPLHDRQHPHDFFMELGALYERQFTPNVAWSLYAAPSGEPALGPVAFMHRPSGMDIPTANISHHWQDATHISFGVLTGGVFTRRMKLEGSVFNGREPDEHRWNFDPIRLDSYSGRLTVNPTANWSLTGGYGYLKSPEGLHPEEPMHRLTASALHGTRLGTDGQWSSAFIWGMNKHPGQDATNGVLAESEAILDAHNTLFGRAEYVQKSAEDVVLDTPLGVAPGGVVFNSGEVFDVGALTLGYIRDLGRWKWATLGVGAQGTINLVPGALKGAYGSRTPLGGLLFVRLRPFHAAPSTMAPMGAKPMGGHAAHR